MGFLNQITNFLRIPKNKEITEIKEKLATYELLLQSNSDMARPKVGASSIARESRQIEDFQGLMSKRVKTKELQLLYLNNQFIFRGVNVRADELITRGYKILGGDDKGVALCKELIENSGGDNLFWQLSLNTDVAGDGYLEKVPNMPGNKIVLLKHINPLNFGFLTEPKDDTQIVMGSDGTPKAYMQKVYNEEGEEETREIDKSRISHLRYNTFGDEFSGISSLQPVYSTAVRLMNMEHAAAEAAVKTANPTWVVKTQTKSPQDLARWVKVLGNVSAKEVVFLPEGVDTKLESPGNQNFSAYSDYFLDAVVAALGVPKSILTGGSDTSGGNRATVQTLSKHFYSVIRANQRYMETLFNDVFMKYSEMAGFVPPKLVFNDIAEDADRNGQRAVDLYTNGLMTLEEARTSIGLETDKKIEKKLENVTPKGTSSKIDPNKDIKKSDMETWHPPEPGSVSGSQKKEKAKKKFDVTVPSVK